jgi:ligand-binding sensor domain-containing protein
MRAWKRFTDKDGLLSNLVYSAAVDHNNNIWFGCKNPNGVSMFDGKKWHSFTSDNSGLSTGHIWDIEVDKDNNLWFATAGGGLCKFDGAAWCTFTIADGLAGNHIYALKVDPSGSLWCGCAPKPDKIVREGGVSMLTGSGFVNYTSDYSQGEYVGGGNSELCDNRVYAIVFEKNGRAWFGTKGRGISCFDGKQWHNFNNSNGLPVVEVGDSAATIDDDGKIWFGLRGGGACCFRNFKIELFSMKDGLAGDFIYAITKGPNGDLWFGCSPDPTKIRKEGGISVFDGKSFSNFTSDHVGGKFLGGGNSPLADNRVYAITFDQEGNAWFGSKGGGISFLEAAEAEKTNL